MRYKFERKGNTIYCTSHYAGKAVMGKASCSPEDKFDEEYGKHIAQLRCDLKIAEKRIKLHADAVASCEMAMGAIVRNFNKHSEVLSATCDEEKRLKEKLKKYNVHN